MQAFLGPSQPVKDHDIEAKVQRSELFSLTKRTALRLHQKLRYWSKAFNLVFIMYVQSVERKSYRSAILLPYMRIGLMQLASFCKKPKSSSFIRPYPPNLCSVLGAISTDSISVVDIKLHEAFIVVKKSYYKMQFCDAIKNRRMPSSLPYFHACAQKRPQRTIFDIPDEALLHWYFPGRPHHLFILPSEAIMDIISRRRVQIVVSDR